MTNNTFTMQDIDRLLGLGDQFLENWEENDPGDTDRIERRKEWNAVRPLLCAAPALRHALNLCYEQLSLYVADGEQSPEDKEALDAATSILIETNSPSSPGGDRTIKITVKGGCVQDVENLPPGWLYEVDDQDER